MSFLAIVQDIFKPLLEFGSELVEDKDKANALRTQLGLAQNAISNKGLELEGQLLAAQSSIVVAEAKSESWVTRNWRPMTMLSFVLLVIGKWFGLTAPDITPEMELELMSLIKIGLGGYVVGRSFEKVAPTIASIFKRK